MSLRLKFNLVMFLVLAVGIGMAWMVSKKILEENAKAEVLLNANIMMEMANGIRKYTVDEVKPAILKSAAAATPVVPATTDATATPPTSAATPATAQVVHAATPVAPPAPAPFVRQTVPAYAATINFNLLREKFPEYTYNEAALNPTNQAHRATDWEKGIIEYFRNNPDAKEYHGIHSTATGDYLYLSLPMKITNPKCLDCHTTPDMAPPSMVEIYGPNNGFGWELNTVVAAQVVSVPLSVPMQRAQKALDTFMGSLAAVFLFVWVLLNILLHFVVIRPIKMMAEKADAISKGQIDVPEFDVKGKDEVASMASSFNRMHRSLASALKLLKQQRQQ
jgi:protein-histidine pros-kinase